MIEAGGQTKAQGLSFRTKLLIAIMLIVFAITGLGLFLAQQNVAATAERDLQQNFQADLSTVHKLQELRHAALADRCRKLSMRPRIHAALEDNALDLLYPSAKDELRDLMEGEEPEPGLAARSLHAKFYRFLDNHGAVLPPPDPRAVGELDSKAEEQLVLKKLPDTQQIGYIGQNIDGATAVVHEVVAVPIFSTESGEVISALVVGFKPFELGAKGAATSIKRGIWVNGRLYLPTISKSGQAILDRELAAAVTDPKGNKFRVDLDGTPHLLFYKQLNPDSMLPPAYEICIYPLAESQAQLSRLRWQIGAAGVLLMLIGFAASRFVAVRMARPVEQLEVDSEKNRVRRKQAEAELAMTAEELERSSRYSADASHQLKSPVAVLRAGVETLLAREDFKPEVYEELSELLHQTHRLTGVIDDLLLLSQMDAGHLRIGSGPVNLSELIEEWVDDLEALPNSAGIRIEKSLPAKLHIAGEKRYTSLVVQNLLENAQKYNRPGGTIRISARADNDDVLLAVGNNGRPIARDVQKDIFKRFQRGSATSQVAGHGLGLNLARELVRLHGGELRLVVSENDWTEFEARFRAAIPAPSRVPQPA